MPHQDGGWNSTCNHNILDDFVFFPNSPEIVSYVFCWADISLTILCRLKNLPRPSDILPFKGICMRGNDSSPHEQLGKHAFFLAAQELRNINKGDATESRDARRNPRFTRTISISLQPLDNDFQPVGDEIWVVSRDLSPKGLGLICHDPINHEYVRVGLLNERITAIGRIRHNTSIGGMYPLFLVGIEFLHETDTY